MSINLSDELHAATTKGKLASAKEVYLDGDKENLQQVGEKTHQLEEAIKGIGASGGASVATAVSYDNKTSGMTSVTAQGAIDELAAKDTSQDAEIAKKADTSEIEFKIQTEQTRVNAELDKKFDKENIAQELGDSEDKVVSQFALPFRIEESEEFLYLIKDGEDHVLFGIQQDGSVEWQVGIPSPIKAKIQEIVNQSQQDKTELSDALNAAKDELNAALQSYKQTTDAAISSLQDTKVDKEEGKSLIEDKVKEHFEVIENDEWFNAMVDEENHILFGIKRDTGKPYFPMNEMYHVEQNEEFFALWLDAEDHILMGIRRDGQIIGEIHAVNALRESISTIQNNIEALQSYIASVNTKVSTIDSSLQELLNVFSIQDNPEFMAVETDADGRILASTNADGSHYAYNLKSETIPEEFSHLEDPEERMHIVTDDEGKIMAYRDKEGVRHEHEMETNTLHVSNLNLKDNSVNDIQSALIANGFNVKTPIDWSESSFIQIPEPRFAIINITNIDSMPTSKTQNKKAFLEFWDMQGNYFKKHAILNAQGSSSMQWKKKNIAIDICDDEWIGDETPNIKFGDWVSQDSFHAKAYWTDFFRGLGAVCYKFYDKIVLTRGIAKDRPWKKDLIDMDSLLSYKMTTKNLGNTLVGEYNLLLDNNAKCHPDGFPCAFYLNDEFYGIFSWQLKKHRDNYNMDKATAEHVHLDGVLSETTIFNGKDNIQWSSFEIRNPKNLYAVGGNKYDADIKMEEIAGETEVNAWIEAGELPDGTKVSSKIKKNLQMTAKVKKYIQNFADVIPTLKEAVNVYNASEKTENDLNTLKTLYEKYFDVDEMIDYQIFSDIICGWDGFAKNWQWTTYNGIKWHVNPYDCDQSFGNEPTGVWTGIPYYQHHLGYKEETPYDKPLAYIPFFYNDELEKRYKELADKDIVSIDKIFAMAKDWVDRVGANFYKEEYTKWKENKCCNNSVVREEYWKVVLDENGNPKQRTNEKMFNSMTSYQIGDVVGFGINKYAGYYLFECIKETEATDVNYGSNAISKYSPISEFRYCDSIYRLYNWIEGQMTGMDTLYKYNRN